MSSEDKILSSFNNLFRGPKAKIIKTNVETERAEKFKFLVSLFNTVKIINDSEVKIITGIIVSVNKA